MDSLVPPEIVDLYVDILKRLVDDPENDELLRQVELKMEFDPRAFGKAAQRVLGDTKHTLAQKHPEDTKHHLAQKVLEDIKDTARRVLEDAKETAQKGLEDAKHTLIKSRVGATGVEVWQNVIDNQHCTPSAIRSPSSLQDLIAIVQEAKSTGKTVRAVGSGHSFSNIAITYNSNSILVKPQGMKQVRITNPSVLLPDAIPSKLVTVESGITIAALNQTLDTMGLALTNMGAFDGQTISGAISTGTHGTGVSLGPIGSSVRAVVLVSESGTVCQIEPKKGISDPTKFKNKNHDIVLKQDDDWFHSIVVSMGTSVLWCKYPSSYSLS